MNRHERYCLTGLVNVETAQSPYTSSFDEIGIPSRKRLLRSLLTAIQTLHSRRWQTIEGWNDAKNTKREDVLAVIDKALEGGD